MGPLKVIIARTIPVEVIYYLNGLELSREKKTPHQIEKQGLSIESFLRYMSQAGVTPVGELRQRELQDGRVELTIPVTKDGRAATFSVTIRATFDRRA